MPVARVASPVSPCDAPWVLVRRHATDLSTKWFAADAAGTNGASRMFTTFSAELLLERGRS
jgi:hypothetical protein